STVKLVIPMAGFGKRLRPHTYSRPKPLLNVAGKSMLAHILDKFEGLDIEEVVFIVGWLGEQVEEYVRANYDFPARFVEQKELLGQAHALWLAKDYLKGPMFIIFVDTLFEADLTGLKEEKADAVAFVKEVEDPRRFGVAVVGEGGYVTSFIEKPPTLEHKLAVVGLYYIKNSPLLLECIKELLEKDIKTKGEYYLADAFQLMIDHGARFAVREVDVWEDCGKPETMLKTNRYLLEHGHDNSAKIKALGFLVIPPVNIHPSAKITASVVGPYATIAAGCEVRGSIVRNSIIDEEAVIEDALLEHSLIGRKARIRGSYRRLNVGDTASVDLGS
ncbi:MAG: sugar phosphate nucleotidyltransferase, partial [Chloroflexota bacterium]|nr:sugar phosphate nucleotidyltransferase [Chloroflexota bacterium]